MTLFNFVGKIKSIIRTYDKQTKQMQVELLLINAIIIVIVINIIIFYLARSQTRKFSIFDEMSESPSGIKSNFQILN